MRFPDLLRLALDNLRRNRTRSGMTMVGVAIGVAALLALLAYGAGIQENAQREFDSYQLYDALRLTSAPSLFGSFGEVMQGRPRVQADSARPSVPLTDSLLAEIAEIDGVLAAYPEVVFPTQVIVNGLSVPAQAEAVPMAFAQLEHYRPATGAFFASPADSAVLLSPSMARRLGYEDPAQLVGQTVLLETVSLHVEGLLRAAPAIATGLTTLPLLHYRTPMRVAGLLPEDKQGVSGFFRVLLPLDAARSLRKITFFSTLDLMLRDGDARGYVAARVQLAEGAPTTLARVQQALEAKGVYVVSFRDQFEQFDRLFLIMDLALGVVGLIALLVATIGIANTMMMNVMERSGEIGVMKAVGGGEGDLQRLFLVESAVLGIVGGLAGLAGGYGLAALIQAAVDYYLHRLGLPAVDVFHFPLVMWPGVLAVALAVSLLAGLAPARRAARIEPLAALRSA